MTSGVPRQATGVARQADEATAVPDYEQSARSVLKRALAEIAERQRLLDGEAPAAPAEPPQASQALVGLEQQLRAINASVEALRPCRVEGAVRTLSEDVRALGAKVERVVDSGVLASLEQRIAAMADILQSRHHSGGETHGLAALLQALIERLERLQLTRADAAAATLEHHLLKLIEKLDTSDARTHDSIEAMQRTLHHVVDRLASIEAGPNSGHAAGYPKAAAIASPAVRRDYIAGTDELPRITGPTASGNPAPASDRPIDPDLPADHPLEPGAARARGHAPAHPNAATETTLDSSRVVSDTGGKSDFIAAARRAAQAASHAPVGRGHKNMPIRGARLGAQPTRPAGNRVRMLLIAASIVLIVLGSLHLLTGLFSGSDPASPNQSARATPNRNNLATQAEQDSAPIAPPSTSAQVTPRTAETPPEPAITGAVSTPGPATAPNPAARPQEAPGAHKLPAAIGGALRTAAIKGDPAAEFEIGVRFAEGRGVPLDFKAAAQWFERAAKQGLPLAQLRLGGLYEKGIGVRKDLDRARHLYLAAAQAGNAKAMHHLAVLYAQGVDGKPDYQAAAKWFRKAADHDVADSQYNLGVLYALGIGTESNLAEAFKWFSLAARQGDQDAAKKRDDVSAQLDPATMMAARAAVEAWRAQPQPEAATQAKPPAGGWGPAPAAAKRRPGPDAKAPRITQ